MKITYNSYRDVTRFAKEAFKVLFLGFFRSLWAIILLVINTAVLAYRKAAQGIKSRPMAAVIVLLFILAISNTVNYVRMKVKLTTAEWQYDQLRIHMDSVYEAYNIHNSYSRLVRYETAN